MAVLRRTAIFFSDTDDVKGRGGGLGDDNDAIRSSPCTRLAHCRACSAGCHRLARGRGACHGGVSRSHLRLLSRRVEHLTGERLRRDRERCAKHEGDKARLGVPAELTACHTGEIGGYVIEGHVPAVAIKRLLAEKPAGRGSRCRVCRSARRAWKARSPEIYEVMLFGDGAPRSFGSYREDKAI